MYFQISYYLVLTLYIQIVYSQVTLLQEFPKYPPFICGEIIILGCQYSGSSTCCSSSTRIWRKNGSQIMSDGNELSTSGKYAEEIDSTGKYFKLTIKNLHASDIGVKYACEYGFDASTEELKFSLEHYNENIKCGVVCFNCGGICFGWGCVGLICSVGFFAVVYICWKPLGIEQRIALLIAAISVFSGTYLTGGLALFGTFYCFCFDYSDSAYNHNFKDPSYLGIFVLIMCAFLVTYLCQKCTSPDCHCGYKEYHLWNILYVLTIGILYVYKKCKGKTASVGSDIFLECPYKAVDKKKITWHKIDDGKAVRYSEGEVINPDLKLKSRLKVTGQHQDGNGEYHLSISNVQQSDEGTYQCSLSGTAGAVYRQQLTVSGENSQSVESGSSCWPICRVGQDPNTSSSDPEKVRRSSKKESADKKPTGFVRPQPSRAQHLGTDNTGRAEYSAENEMYSEKLLKSNKPRLLPSIGQQTDSPRPLPQMPASAQQGGNQLAPLEKKKKKRKKKREAKQSDEENSTEL